MQLKIPLCRFVSVKFLILLLVVSLGLNLHAQCKFTWGYEMGLSMSGLPYTDSWENPNQRNHRHSYLPVVSPVLGVWAKTPKKYFLQVATGLQLQAIGTVHTSLSTGARYNKEEYEHSGKEYALFSRIALPLSLHIRLAKRKNVRLELGYKKVFYTSGKYASHSISKTDGKVDGTSSYSKRIFDPNVYAPTSRWNNEAFLGISFDASRRLNLAFQVSSVSELSYNKSPIWNCIGDLSNTYTSEIYSVLLKYRLR